MRQPAPDNNLTWHEYWKMQGRPWRTEPEIDAERQKYLAERRLTEPDYWKDIYPFTGVKLTRADVEWLLGTDENGRGLVGPKDKSQRRLYGLFLQGANLSGEDLQSLPLGMAYLKDAHLENAKLTNVHLEDATLDNAHLENARLYSAHMERASLRLAHMEGANLIKAHLEGAVLINAFFDSATRLDNAIFSNKEFGAAGFLDVHWGDVNLAAVDWSTVSISGDENRARYAEKAGKPGRIPSPTEEYERASRAYRQLSIGLRNQGVSEDANRFAYRAQLMQREAFRRQRKRAQYLGSLLLDLITGYGYKPMRSFLAYLIVIIAFATAYFIIGRMVEPALSPLGSFVFSMTSFHGRGFFPGGIKLDDPLTVLAALEALVGLLIEVTFIATLTRRLFGQ